MLLYNYTASVHFLVSPYQVPNQRNFIWYAHKICANHVSRSMTSIVLVYCCRQNEIHGLKNWTRISVIFLRQGWQLFRTYISHLIQCNVLLSVDAKWFCWVLARVHMLHYMPLMPTQKNLDILIKYTWKFLELHTFRIALFIFYTLICEICENVYKINYAILSFK